MGLAAWKAAGSNPNEGLAGGGEAAEARHPPKQGGEVGDGERKWSVRGAGAPPRTVGLTANCDWKARRSENKGGEGQGVVFEALLNLMSRALDGIGSLPWGIHLVVALGMAAGLVLWLAGQKVIKPLVVTLIAALGGLVGGLVVPSTAWGASFSAWHGIGMGAVAGLLVGLLLYRSALAVGFGVVLGILLPLGAATILSYYPLAGASAGGGEAAAWSGEDLEARAGRLVRGAMAEDELAFQIVRAGWQGERAADDEAAPLVEELPENLKPAADAISECWQDAKTSIAAEWSELPGAHRLIVLLCGAVGLATGVIAGLALPGWAAAAVTAMFGAAVWMSCLVWLSNAFSAPWRGLLDRTAPQWLAAWAVAAVIGLVIQRRMRRKGRKPAPAAAAG